MKFEEMLKKYRAGTATDAERAAVEAEVRKFRLLEELALDSEPPLPLPEVKVSEGEVKAVRRTIDRRTRKTAITVVCAVLAVILLLQYLLFPWLNSRIYDVPDYNEGRLSEYELWMDSVTELYLPEYRYYGSWRERTGFGEWEISHSFQNSNGRFLPKNTVSRGNFRWNAEAFNPLFPAVNVTDHLREGESWSSGHDNALSKMGEDVVVLATVVFQEDLTMEELLHFKATWWADKEYFDAALSEPLYSRPIHLDLAHNPIGWGDAVNEGYPLLYIGQDLDALTAADWQQHLESRLQYLIDHPTLTNKIEDVRHLQRYLDTIKAEGAKFKGVWLKGSAQELLALYDSGMISHIWPQEAHISLYETPGN